MPIAPLALLALSFCSPQTGTVIGAQKISDRYGALPPPLRNGDQFGRAITRLGDLDLDGVVDIAVGAHGDDDGGLERGSVYVLFLEAGGTVKNAQKISALAGGFAGPLRDGDQFARAIEGLGDLDGDGVPDLAVGANFDDDGGGDRGAVWILFLNRDGTVRAQSKISSLSGLGGLRDRDEFGRALALAGDVDGDGVQDLYAAAPYDDAGGANKGAVHLLLLTRAGTLKGQRKISALSPQLTALRANDLFGFALTAPGDLDGDGVRDLVAGAVGDDDGGSATGAIWILFLNADTSVRARQKISRLAGGFTGILDPGDQFGDSVGALGDLDGDGRSEIAVGAVKDDDGGRERGALWILFPNANGTVARQQKISDLEGNFLPPLRTSDWFGSSVSALGDLNGDGALDLAVGARMDDDLGANRGALYVTFLAGPAAPFRAGSAPGTQAPAAGSLKLVRSSGEAHMVLAGAERASLLVSHGCLLDALAGLPGLRIDPRRLARAPIDVWIGAGGSRELRLPPDFALGGRPLFVQAWFPGAHGSAAFSELLELTF